MPFALGAMFLALSRPNTGGLMAVVGKCSLGLFVLHPYVIEVLLRLPLKPLVPKPLLLAGIVFAVTFAALQLIRRIRYLRSIAL